MAKPLLDRAELLKKLAEIKSDPRGQQDEEQFRKMSLAGALLALAEIDHEREYALCRAVAEHRLGTVPEPDDIDLGE